MPEKTKSINLFQYPVINEYGDFAFFIMKEITSFFFQENYAAISDKLFSENFMSSCLFKNT
jgi:hypothetical protein